MSVWDKYEIRMGVRGLTEREAYKKREEQSINRRLPNNLSYFEVTIDGIPQIVSIDNSDNLNEKTIRSMPGEDIRHGGLVEWMNERWLITEKDANTTIYARGKLLQCNYLLKWIDSEHVIHEQWCCVEDGTKLEIASAYRNVREKLPIELLEQMYVIYTYIHPKANRATA